LISSNIFKFLQIFLLTRLLSRIATPRGGEDIILRRFLPDKYRGFYVDIGAHHPRRFSNLYLLYQNNRRGVNVDDMPGSMIEFRRWLPRDINLEIGVSDHEGTMTYHIFKEPALNTFDFDLAEKYIQDGIPFYL